MADSKYLLTDEQMQHFIVNGYINIKTDLPADFHEAIFQQTEAVFEEEGNPGNNLIPRIPDIQEIFDHPVVDGVLTGLVGPNYYTHPHRHCHYNPPGSSGQRLHKDSWTRRRHPTRWVMAFYYPQDTPEVRGPTGVLPQSQCYNDQPDNGQQELPLAGEAGSMTIVHYDLWHRAMPNRTEMNRYMMKFLFTRMEEPQSPSWNNEETEWTPSDDGQRLMWKHLWAWHLGTGNGTGAAGNGSIPELISALRSESESACLNAAYALGAVGESAVSALIETLQDESEIVRRNASYALSVVGSPAVPVLIEAANDSNEGVRTIALDALGDMGSTAQEAVPTLIKRTKDESAEVRKVAAEGLGIVAQSCSTAVPALMEGLSDTDEWVRRNSSLALARIGSKAEEALPALKTALKDENRYVRANAAHTLHQIGTTEARDILMHFLMKSRWCASTTRESGY
ncbi:phytanoyl-CoA dioxygenase [Candidatus Poribacteria bacterium]|nr:phytanoyl-CoA dioxygenase [Candidatus Poribacteria bacterium]